MKHVIKILAQNILKIRETRQLSQGSFADLLETSQSRMSRIERANEAISLDFLNRIIKKTDCQPADLFLQKDQHIIGSGDYKLLNSIKECIKNNHK